MADSAAKAIEAERVRKKLILEYITKKDVPGWLRGTSRYQMNAANILLHAIRDDTQQHTCYRVRECLATIGLNPLPKSKDIKLVMQLSGLNDLAFLYFLMEMYYKTSTEKNNVKTYSMNEQLIMSSICHLDMITTLRGLDRILPDGRKSRKWKYAKRLAERQKLCAKRFDMINSQLKALEPDKKNDNIQDKQKLKSPYFKNLGRPKFIGTCPIMTIPDFRVKFGSYKKYQDKEYIVENESTRWFATFEFNGEKRMIFRIINEEVANIFDDLTGKIRDVTSLNCVCMTHKQLKDQEELIKAEHALKMQKAVWRQESFRVVITYLW